MKIWQNFLYIIIICDCDYLFIKSFVEMALGMRAMGVIWEVFCWSKV